MVRTISIIEILNSGIDFWFVKDDSPRGIRTVYAGEINLGDKVVIDNYFTLVVSE